MRRFCTCGHSEAWHVEKPGDWLDTWMRVISFLPSRKVCELCECTAYWDSTMRNWEL